MSKPMIDGKKHISEKPKSRSLKEMFRPRNLLDLPPEVEADFESKGLVGRWLDSKQMADQGNVHKNHWQIYRRPAGTVSNEAQVFGLPPDGTVRRGTMVLGCRPKEVNEAHKEFLQDKANAQVGSVKKQGAELRAYAKSLGLNEHISDETEIDKK